MPNTSHPLIDAPFRSVGELLDTYRRHTPDKAAIVDVERNVSITFGELAKVVDAVGRRLQQRGVRRGSRVGLTGEGVEKLLLWLGIWRIGAVVCPLDPAFASSPAASKVLAALDPALILLPEHEDTLRFSQCGVALLRFGRWPASGAEGADALRFCPDDADEPLAPEVAGQLADAAAICCTSGTSGTPKLVLYDHACYWYNGLDSIEQLGLGANDRMLEYRSFDWYSAQILSLMPFLQTGLTLCLARRFSRSGFAPWIARHRVTVCTGVPAVLSILLEAPIDVTDGSLRSLRLMTCSTAPLATAQWTRFEDMYGVRVLTMYGSSEAGWICANRPEQRRIGSVGYPAARTGFDIVDRNGTSCGPNQEGQVVVTGAKLALGLLRADGSIEPIRGAPLYTRDIATRDADGFVRLLGRMDDLIIRGGVKIMPQEIEDVLLAHHAVRDAVALGVPDQIYGQESACFVVPQARGSLDASMLLAHCRQHLPRAKMPKYVYVVESLPRSARGKILRDALRREWWTATNAPGK